MAKTLSWGVVGVVLVAAGGVCGAQPYTLERTLTVGARKQVEEQRSTRYQYLWKGPHAKVGDAEASELIQRYTEEVRSGQPELLLREYELSTRSKHHPQEKPEHVKTSLSGQRVLVNGLELKPQTAFQVSKADREAMRMDRLAQAMLPPARVVAAKASWKIASKPLVEALFGPYVPDGNHDCSAKVDLRSVKQVDGRQVATLRVRAKIHVDRSESFPQIDMALKGEVKWAVAEGTMLAARLEGPLTYVIPQQRDGGEAELHLEGSTQWSYAAELMLPRASGEEARAAGSPPPPGTRILVCSLEPKHRLGIEHWVRCTTCGKALDKDRECPDQHPWPLQHCPHDGAVLEPE